MSSQRLADAERRVEALADSVNRVPPVSAPRTQLLRLFVTQKFVPSSAIEVDANGEKERPYFVVRIDGILFDLGVASQRQVSVSSFVDAANVTVFADRKQNVLCAYDWSTSSFPAGLSADSIVFKVAAEKSSSCRVELRFTDNVAPKFSLSPLLRDLLQAKSSDMRKQDICEAFLYQVALRRLFLDKDARSFRVDEALLPLLGEDRPVRTSDFWSKLQTLGHVTLLDKLELDLSLSTTTQAATIQAAVQAHLSTATGGSSLLLSDGPSADLASCSTVHQLWRSIGGRCVDVEVLRPTAATPTARLLCAARQRVAEARYLCDQRGRQRQDALAFLRRELREDAALCDGLRAAVAAPPSAGSKRPLETVAPSADLPKQPIPTEYVARPRRPRSARRPCSLLCRSL